MLIHCVFLNFAPEHSTKARMAVLQDLAEFAAGIDGMLGFSYGPNRDYENKTPDHSEGFVITFRDRTAHLAYDGHPRHKELGGQLVSMCVGGVDGILVYDIEAA